MKKIGIITLNGNSNFGNKLQNYALLETLNRMDDNEVSTIWMNNKKSLKNHIKIIISSFIRTKGYRRVSKFKEFNKLLNIKRYKDLREINEYDYLIVGSDQVWNYNFSSFNYDLYFAINTAKKKNIAYAASFGISTIEKKYEKMYKKGLNNFKSISVREYSGKEIVQDLTKRNDVEVLIDPTMLLTEDKWDKLIVAPKEFPVDKKYILNYFLGELSEERKKEIRRIANENDCTIINILDKNDPYYAMGPKEFLYLEKNAFLICTDSFHSTVFAILFNRPFFVFEREDSEKKMNSRLDTLLANFNFENRRFNGHISEDLLKCDYSHVDAILETERRKAEDFLSKAINTEGK